MSLSTGTRLGPYEVLAPIGAGGMGEVYRAKDPRLGREVAIKVLSSSFSADAERLRRFEQEARAAGILNHPNLTAVLDIGEHEGAPYVVQELLEGETLRGTLASGRLAPRRAIDFAIQIAHGLAAAHEKGIVHRDLKPENIFVTRDGRVKILDFGLAKLTHPEERGQLTNLPTASAGTEPGVVLGTLGYMSPEQVRGKPADARSDIFSFGAILYEMLSGVRAFRGDSAADTMSAILREDPPDLSLTNQNISPGLERIVRHCLEKNPEQRFHSAHDLAFDLEALSGPSGAAVAVSAGKPTVAGKRLYLALAAVGLLAIGWAIGHFLGRSSRSQPPTFQRLTFRRSNIVTARFAPDGQTIVYGAAFGGNPVEIFTTRPGSPESTAIGVKNATPFAVSATGELAISLRERRFLFTGGVGTLASVPLAGGTPKPILEFAEGATWSPDGKQLAVIRQVEGRHQLEYPIGKVWYGSGRSLNYPRIAPTGDLIAVVEGRRSVVIVGRNGKLRKLTDGWEPVTNLAWSPRGSEIWFSAQAAGGQRGIWAVNLAGHLRQLFGSPDFVTLHDRSRDGRALVERYSTIKEILVRPPGSAEKELSWFDQGEVVSMSPAGNLVLFNDTGATGKTAIYVRRTDGSPAVRVGEGRAHALSPDGQWVLASQPDSPHALTLFPIGTGVPKTVSLGSLEGGGRAAFFPDGRRILLVAREASRPQRLYVVNVGGGAPRVAAPEGFVTRGNPVSPDGRSAIVIRDWTEDCFVQTLEGGAPKPIPGTKDLDPIRWSADGKFFFAQPTGINALRIVRVDPETGRREAWKDSVPPDQASVLNLWGFDVTSDGEGYAYDFFRNLSSDLFLVEGLK